MSVNKYLDNQIWLINEVTRLRNKTSVLTGCLGGAIGIIILLITKQI